MNKITPVTVYRDTVVFDEEIQQELLPSYLYYLMELHKWNFVKFGSKIYNRIDLKGKEDWKDVRF